MSTFYFFNVNQFPIVNISRIIITVLASVVEGNSVMQLIRYHPGGSNNTLSYWNACMAKCDT